MKTRGPLCVSLSLLTVLFCLGLHAQEDAAEAEGGLVVKFDPPVKCVIKLVKGSKLEARLISFSKEEVVTNTGKLAIAKVQEIKIGKILIRPDEELFEDLVKKLQGLPEAATSGKAEPKEAETNTETETETDPPPMVDPNAGKFRIECGECGKVIHITGKSGQRCPHCKALFSDSAIREIMGTVEPVPSTVKPKTVTGTKPNPLKGGNNTPKPNNGGQASNPFLKAAPAPTPPNGVIPDNGGGQGVVPQNLIVPPPPPVVAAPPMDWNNMPVSLKVGAFVGMLAIGWIVLQIRS